MFPWTRVRIEREQAERVERAEERRAFLAAVQGMTAASTANAAAFQSFMDSFKLTEAPRVRGFDEQADFERWMEARNLTGRDEYIGQFQALAQKFDEFDLGD